LFFKKPYHKLLSEILKGNNAETVLQNNTDLLEIIKEYSNVIKHYSVKRSIGIQFESYKFIKEKTKELGN
jgi:hypothetical protein